MAAIGCLMPLVLPLVGAAIGNALLGSAAGGLWGLGIGFVAGVAIAVSVTWLFARAKADR